MLRRWARGALDVRENFRKTLPRAAALILVAACAATAGSGVYARTPAWMSDATPPAASSGATLTVSELPPEGRKTYGLIRAGGPFPFDKDGVTFGNREKLLPKQVRGYYREYTVVTPQARNRGARRIICGGAPRTPDRCYYTADHYASFREIVQ